LIKCVAFLFGNHGYVAIGMLLSNAALLGALFVLYQLATDILGNQVARRTLLYLCIFPTAFFFFAAYNESLFLLLTTSVFLAMRRQKWWLAGFLGFFAALTRSAGVLLVIPYFYEVWETWRADRAASTKLLLARLAPAFFIVLGTLTYSFYCWKTFGDPFAFINAQERWQRHISWPWTGLWAALLELITI